MALLLVYPNVTHARESLLLSILRTYKGGAKVQMTSPTWDTCSTLSCKEKNRRNRHEVIPKATPLNSPSTPRQGIVFGPETGILNPSFPIIE
jgi:hypothetical protein